MKTIPRQQKSRLPGGLPYKRQPTLGAVPMSSGGLPYRKVWKSKPLIQDRPKSLASAKGSHQLPCGCECQDDYRLLGGSLLPRLPHGLFPHDFLLIPRNFPRCVELGEVEVEVPDDIEGALFAAHVWASERVRMADYAPLTTESARRWERAWRSEFYSAAGDEIGRRTPHQFNSSVVQAAIHCWIARSRAIFRAAATVEECIENPPLGWTESTCRSRTVYDRGWPLVDVLLAGQRTPSSLGGCTTLQCVRYSHQVEPELGRD